MVRLRLVVLVALPAAAACSGKLAEGDAPGEGGGPATPPAKTDKGGPAGSCRIGSAPLRRLTRAEYDATVRDLLGDKGTPGDGIPADDAGDGFDTDVRNQGASPLLAGGYLKAAEKIAARIDLTPVLPCAPASGDDACARAFIDRLGKRAYRRPLRPAETTQLVSFFTAAQTAYGFEQAARTTVQLLLSSPQFLYRVETSSGKLTPYEVATRLSYFVWGTMPDDALFAAADAGQLATKDQVAAQANRMLADPRARTRLRDFARQWLVLGDLGDVMRDAKLYKGWSDALTSNMAGETMTFAEKMFFDENGSYAQLVSAPVSYMSKALATYLGVTGPMGNTYDKVMLDPTRAAGLLTLSGPLTMNSKEDQPHPIYRGRWVRQHLLCTVPPPPPPSVMAQTPKLTPGASTRQVFTQHSADPSCAGCHRLLDPIGFGLEQYDATGKWRANDHGLPIDANGELVDAGDASGPFNGAAEMGKRLATSDTAAGCLATQMFRYARGRDEGDDDRCALDGIRAQVRAAGGNLRALLVAMTQTDDFLVRAAPPAGGP